MSTMAAPMGPGFLNVSLDVLMNRDLDQNGRDVLETFHKVPATTSTTASADLHGEPASKRQKLQSEPPVDSAEAALLRGGRKKPPWTPAEQAIVAIKHCELGNRWTQIAAYLPLRSENDVKNIWHSTLRCKDTQKRSFLRTYALAVHDHAYDYATRKVMFDIAVRQCGPPPPQAAEMIARVQLMLDNPELHASMPLQQQQEQLQDQPFAQQGQQPHQLSLFQKRDDMSQPQLSHLQQLQQHHLLLLQQHQQRESEEPDAEEDGSDRQARPQHRHLPAGDDRQQQQQQLRLGKPDDKDADVRRAVQAVRESSYGDRHGDTYGSILGRGGGRGGRGDDALVALGLEPGPPSGSGLPGGPGSGSGPGASGGLQQQRNHQLHLQQQQHQLAALLQEQAHAAAALRTQFQVGGHKTAAVAAPASVADAPASVSEHQQPLQQGGPPSRVHSQGLDSGGIGSVPHRYTANGNGNGNGNCTGNAIKASNSSGNDNHPAYNQGINGSSITRANSGNSNKGGAGTVGADAGSGGGVYAAPQADPILPLALTQAAAAMAAAAAAAAATTSNGDTTLPPPPALNPGTGDDLLPAPERPPGASLPALGNLLALLYRYNIEQSQAQAAGAGAAAAPWPGSGTGAVEEGREQRNSVTTLPLPPALVADTKAPIPAAAGAMAAPAAVTGSGGDAGRKEAATAPMGPQTTQTQGLTLRPLALRPLATQPSQRDCEGPNSEVDDDRMQVDAEGYAAGSVLLKLKDSPTRGPPTRGDGARLPYSESRESGGVTTTAGISMSGPPPAPRPRGMPMSYSLQDADADELGAVEALALAARMNSQSSRAAANGGGGRLSGPSAGSAFASGGGSAGSGRSSSTSFAGGSSGGGSLGSARNSSVAGAGSLGARVGANANGGGSVHGSAATAPVLDLHSRPSLSSHRPPQPPGPRERLLLQPLHGGPPPPPPPPLPPASSRHPPQPPQNPQRQPSLPPPPQPAALQHQQLSSRGGMTGGTAMAPPVSIPAAAVPSLDVVSVLNLPSLRRQVLALPPQALLALLSSPAFGADSEASVLLLVALWLQFNADNVTAEAMRAVCSAVRVAALGGFHLSAILPHLLSDPRVTSGGMKGAGNSSGSGVGGGRWFEMRPEELAFLANFVHAGAVERSHLADAARGVYDCTNPWYDTTPRSLGMPPEGFSFKWHIPQQGLREALASSAQPHASFTLSDGGGAASGSEADGGGADGSGAAVLPYIMCRGLEWHVFVDCQRHSGGGGAASANGGAGPGGGSVAGVFLYCRVPSALSPGGGGGAAAAGSGVGVVPGGGIRLGVYGWRCGRLEEVFVWTFGDETYFMPEGAIGCPGALPLRKRIGTEIGGGGAGRGGGGGGRGGGGGGAGEELLAPWSDYLHEGGLRGTLTFLPL